MHHLPRIGSDHNPILLSELASHHRRSHYFRFENMWTKQPGFVVTVCQAWDSISRTQPILSDKLHTLQTHLLSWKRKTFGSLTRDLQVLQRRINGLQASRHYSSSSYLHLLDVDLQQEYSRKRLQHEMFWKQRSHIQWLQEGDHMNSKFFHRVAKSNHHRNKIHYLIDD